MNEAATTNQDLTYVYVPVDPTTHWQQGLPALFRRLDREFGSLLIEVHYVDCVTGEEVGR